jgi:hypothetical protein
MALPRVQHSTLSPTKRVEWPDNPKERGAPLFLARARLRHLVVVADAACLATPDSHDWSPELLLAGLLTHQYIKSYRYADDGPPADIPRKQCGFYSVVEGWVELLPTTNNGDVRPVLFASNSGSVTEGGIVGNRTDVAGRDIAARSYQELGADRARAQREADALAAQAAEVVGADLFITERPYLYETRAQYANGVTICKPRDALAFIGLYLRAQDQYITYRSPFSHEPTFSTDRGSFYWIGARELLPAAWRWFSACVQHAHNGGDKSLVGLGESLLRRTQTALEARDRLHIGLNQGQDNNTARQILDAIDVIVVSLMSAVDVAARVAHTVLGLQSDIYYAGWQKRQWLGELRGKATALAAIVDVNTRGADVLTILRLLRNSVHGAALSSMSVRKSGRPIETRIKLPQADTSEIVTAMDALGGRTAWGVIEITSVGSYVDPGTFVEKLFPYVITLFNDLMIHTPVEQLPHVQLTPQNLLPPANGERGLFDEKTRQSICWQLGF